MGMGDHRDVLGGWLLRPQCKQLVLPLLEPHRIVASPTSHALDPAHHWLIDRICHSLVSAHKSRIFPAVPHLPAYFIQKTYGNCLVPQIRH